MQYRFFHFPPILCFVIMPPPLICGGVCLTSDVCLTSVAYIGPKSRTERPSESKIGLAVAYVTRDSDSSLSGSKGQRSKSPGRFGWLFKSLHNVCRRDQYLHQSPEWAALCRWWIFMEQGALGAAGIRRVGYGLEVSRSVRTAGGAGILCLHAHSLLMSASRAACSWAATICPATYKWWLI